MKKSFTLILVLAGVQLFTLKLSAQNVGIGTTMPLAPLDVIGKIRTTDFQITGGASNGNILQCDASGNASWTPRSSVMVNEWHLNGNAGTVDGTNFIGTTDNVPFTIKMNNQRSGRIENAGANTFFGYLSGNANTGSENTALGKNALKSNTTASANTAIGVNALLNQSYSPGASWNSENTAVGYYTLLSNEPTSYDNARYNTAIGSWALFGNTIGYNNTALGRTTLVHNISGNENTAVGVSALYFNTVLGRNTAIGNEALYNQSYNPGSSQSSYNVAVGYRALYSNEPTVQVNGIDNTALGSYALADNTTGSNNTATGFEALTNNTVGIFNTANGYQALTNNTDGSHNTAFGMNALTTNISGDYNTAFGRAAYYVNSGLDNTTCIGYNAGGIVNASNRIEIGNSSVTWIGGQVGWLTYSDARIKDNVKEDVPGLSFISKLRPVTYNLNIHKQNAIVYKGTNKDSADWATKYDIEKIKMTGFLAQDVERAALESGYDFSGVQKPASQDELYSLRYSDFVMPLVKAVQELNVELKSEVEKLKSENAALADRLTQIEILLGGRE